MLGLLIASAVVGGLVALAARAPEIRRGLADEKYAVLAQKIDGGRSLTLDEAEDGAVLARQRRDRGREEKFRQAAGLAKKRRT